MVLSTCTGFVDSIIFSLIHANAANQPEFRPILFPIFCHFYLDLIQFGFKDAGE